MNNIDTLKTAISKKQNVRFTYQGHERLCSPHALGYKGSRVNVLAYQYGGMTSKGPVVGDSASNWRCLHLEEVQGVETIEGEWHSFENHSRPSSCIDTMIAEVT